MFVHLDGITATIEECDDFHRLHVASKLDRNETDSALRHAGIGYLTEDGDALLSIRVLHERAAKNGSVHDWERQWTKMIDYASSHGWISADEQNVRAHIETATSGG